MSVTKQTKNIDIESYITHIEQIKQVTLLL